MKLRSARLRFFPSSLYLAMLIGFLFTIGCSTTTVAPKKKTPPPASSGANNADANNLYRQAQTQVRASNQSQALETFMRLVKTHPNSNLVDSSYLMIGDILVQKGDTQKAQAAYNKVLTLPYESPKEADARVKLSKIWIQLKDSGKARAVLEEGLAKANLDDASKAQLMRAKLNVLRESGLPLESLKAVLQLHNNATLAADKELYKNQAYNIVETQLSQDQLLTVADGSEYGIARGPAVFKAGLNLYEQGDFSRSRRFFNAATNLVPGTEIATRAAQYMQQLDSRERVQPKVIGAILPLSGKFAKMGQRALHGLQLGLGIFGKERGNEFRLAVIDSEANASVTRRAVERLVTEDNVIAIVGGMLSREAVTLGNKAQELGVPTLTLSQKAGITQIGDFVFRNALTSEMQVRYLVDVAMRERHLSKFAILYPNDPYGNEYANLFWDEVLARGGQIKAAQIYDPKETDFRGPIQRLVGTFYLEDRMAEYQFRMRDWEKKTTVRTDRKSPPKDLLPPVVDFDAVFIPDSVKAVGQIAPMFAYNDVHNIAFLGTNLWNTKELIERAGKSMGDSLFVDSYVPETSGGKSVQFNEEFLQVFGAAPELFEIMAYESAQVLKSIIQSGEGSRDGLAKRLATLKNFEGVSGRLTMSSSREIVRPMTALTIKDEKIVPVSIAR